MTLEPSFGPIDICAHHGDARRNSPRLAVRFLRSRVHRLPDGPRYQALYDWVNANAGRATTLFDLFNVWRRRTHARTFSRNFERTSSRLCGCAGLRQAREPEGTAVFGLELTPNDWGRYGVAIEVACALIEYGFRALRLHTITVGKRLAGRCLMTLRKCRLGDNGCSKRNDCRLQELVVE